MHAPRGTIRRVAAALALHIFLQSQASCPSSDDDDVQGLLQVATRDGQVVLLQVASSKLTHKPVVDIFYESQCPYSLSMLNGTLRHAWKDKDIWNAVDVKFHPFGNAKVYPQSKLSHGYKFWHNDAMYPVVKCQHDEVECLGNIIHTCAMDLYPEDKYVPFMICMSSMGLQVGVERMSYECGTGLGLDMDKVKNCTEAKTGHEMVIAEGKATDNANITGVPWVLVDGKQVNEDGSMPEELETMMKICDALTGTKPAACQGLAEKKAKKALAEELQKALGGAAGGASDPMGDIIGALKKKKGGCPHENAGSGGMLQIPPDRL